MARRKYDWKIGGVLPTLDWHSVAKHKVLRDYLRLYVQVLTQNPRRDRLTLTLVDGFCGGGMYLDPHGVERLGSPLHLIDGVQEAGVIASGTRTKPFSLDAEFYFIDEDRSACAHLEHVLKKHPHPRDRTQVLLGSFQSRIQSLIERIQQRGTAHRCIFVLDQYGYMDAPMGTIRKIFSQLPHAEVLLTFATDSLIDYLGDNEASQKRLDALGFSLSTAAILEAKTQEPLHWKRVIQHDLHPQIHAASGAKHYTPFFIRSPVAHRSYWLIHLSNHHRARDVMTRLHWESGNDFEHYGAAGLDMFGYDCQKDPLVTGQRLFNEATFCFDADAKKATHTALLEDSPRKLAMMGSEGVTFDDFFAHVTNHTPATSQQLRGALNELAGEGEVDIFSPNGARRRADVAINKNDRLSLPRQLRLLPVATN